MLVNKARDYFGPLCGVPNDFKYSNGWLAKFKKSYNISLRIICDGSARPLEKNLDDSALFLKKTFK